MFFMRRKRSDRLKYWELALLAALALSLLWGVWSLRAQDTLGEKMIRLHVIANSDTPADQTLKLQVRDRVLAEATKILKSSADMAQAQAKLAEALPELEKAAAEEIYDRGYTYPVSAHLEKTEFPTKQYDGFALPSGEYTALRLLIGEAKGRNWWCVVYPPLCTAAASDLEETAIASGMEGRDISLMTEKNTGYTLKFRSLELWENFRQWLKKR